ncbi:hypothetical protein [Sphingomonas sp. NPDC079357]|uniref:hypothetical protein n=1 Tax=Sphingomonas sp. NPDC079357 TaxID=3364518 RepID=UPI00384C905E
MIADVANPAAARTKPLPDPARITAARIRLVEQGLTAVAWAKSHGESPVLVSKVLSGTRSCVRGQSRRIAVKLGIVDSVVAAPAPVARDRRIASQRASA